MPHYRIAVFSINQWALDFTGNCRRILDSIRMTSEVGAAIRVGPELEICGYSCEDAFYEQDTVSHSWEVVRSILEYPQSKGIIIDVGMPVMKNSARYNCRIIIYNQRILLIRPKTRLAMNGNYREMRHFTSWQHDAGLVWFRLPSIISQLTGQKWAPFGSSAILELPHGLATSQSSLTKISHSSNSAATTFRLGFEICQEMWDYDSLNVEMYGRHGCHLIVNSSASYWELRKLDTLQALIKSVTLKSGGVYAFSNLIGCDGQRVCFYGRSCVYVNGELSQMTSINQDVMQEVQMCFYDIDPCIIEQYRSQLAIRMEPHNIRGSILDINKSLIFCPNQPMSDITHVKVLFLDEHLQAETDAVGLRDPMLSQISFKFQDEIYMYGSLWLWDYLRRSSMLGFVVPLSGGLDSSSVVCLIYSMCTLLMRQIEQDNTAVCQYFEDLHSIPKNQLRERFRSPSDICKVILECFYLSTVFSGQATFNRAEILCRAIGCKFSNFNFQLHYSSMRSSLMDLMGISDSLDPNSVTILDQNLQARLRMASIYYLSNGKRIVLASGNVDEALMGYLTKYDCSSADINPIGGICKRDLCSFMEYCREKLSGTLGPQLDKAFSDVIRAIVDAPPSAELTGENQRDEVEIGLTYDEIACLGRIRRGQHGCCGPLGMFQALWQRRYETEIRAAIRNLTDGTDPVELAKKVKIFFTRYARNRHKLTVLTPALHAETYSPDDNRFDHRPFLIDSQWQWQFKRIDEEVEQLQRNQR